MSYQALYRVWRPERFSDIVGQDPIVTTLIHQIESGRIAHAYLFCGSRGTGKTTTAKLLARAINCMNPGPGAEPCGVCDACVQLASDANMDTIEIDAASNNGVDEIRDLREKIKYPPSVGRYKVYIIDEVHMLSTGAFNALLKTLEEPPAHAVFILATTEPQKLPATILSRCQRFDFRRIPAAQIVERMRQILLKDALSAEEEALELIARAAEGGMRDALSLLDMCLSFANGPLTAEDVRHALGSSDASFLFAFADALIDENAGSALELIDQMMRDGRDPAVFAREVTGHIRALLLAQYCGAELSDLLEVSRETAAHIAEQSARASRDKLMRAMDLFIRAESDMKWFSQPRSVLELCAVRCCHPEKEISLSTLTERMDALEKALASGQLANSAQASPIAVEGTPAQPPTADAPRRPAAPKPQPQSAKKDAAPRSAGPDAARWEETVQAISKAQGSMAALVSSAVFDHRDGDVIYLSMPKKWRMYLTILDTPAKKEIVEQALTTAYGRPMRVQVSLEGDAPAKPTLAARQTLEQAYEVFGREHVIVMDEE